MIVDKNINKIWLKNISFIHYFLNSRHWYLLVYFPMFQNLLLFPEMFQLYLIWKTLMSHLLQQNIHCIWSTNLLILNDEICWIVFLWTELRHLMASLHLQFVLPKLSGIRLQWYQNFLCSSHLNWLNFSSRFQSIKTIFTELSSSV